jgi:flagellar biosynthesis/type III secretory pathway ATPase
MTAYRVTGSTVDVSVHDLPVAIGLTSGLRERRVRAKAVTLRFREDGALYRVEITGPYERSDGSLTAVYTTVLVDADDSDRYRPMPEWVREIVDAVSPR